MEPTISVVIPTIRRPSLLERAVLSVTRQSVPPHEVLVVVDSKSDTLRGKYERAVPRHCMVISNGRDPGASGARNTGASAACGLFVAFLDDDDEWLPEYLAAAQQSISGAQADVVCTSFVTPDPVGHDIDEKEAPSALKPNLFLVRNPGLRGSNLVVRRELFLQVGGFCEALVSHNDLDLGIRLAETPGLRYVGNSQRLVRFHNHAGPRLSTPRSNAKRKGIAEFYRRHWRRMTPSQRTEFREHVTRLWGIDETGAIV